MNKTGILLINLGTPDAPSRSAVYRYLKQFLLDKRVIDIPWLFRNLLVRGIIAPFRSGSSAKLYKMLWTEDGSPLKFYGERLRDKLQIQMGQEYKVVLGMRYQNPSMQSALDELQQPDIDKIIVLPLFPQYASATTGSVHEELMHLVHKQQVIRPFVFINSYPDFGPMIDVFVENSRKYDLNNYDHFIFSYHGLPQRQLKKADAYGHCLQSENCCKSICPENKYCYSAQCHSTSYAIAEKLGLSKEQYTISFQSRLGPDAWVQPYTEQTIKDRATKGDKRILVFCPAFVADCLETTIEIGEEYKETFEELGGEHLDLVESLNDNPAWISAVKELVLSYA